MWAGQGEITWTWYLGIWGVSGYSVCFSVSPASLDEYQLVNHGVQVTCIISEPVNGSPVLRPIKGALCQSNAKVFLIKALEDLCIFFLR